MHFAGSSPEQEGKTVDASAQLTGAACCFSCKRSSLSPHLSVHDFQFLQRGQK